MKQRATDGGFSHTSIRSGNKKSRGHRYVSSPSLRRVSGFSCTLRDSGFQAWP